VDLHGIEWSRAWELTQATISYTNHTLLPEAVESWPVPLMERLLPRHMQIVYLINARHLDDRRVEGRDDPAFLSSVSIIDEHDGRRVRMGHLAFLGSHKVNGVSALHSALLEKTLFHDLSLVHPGRIVNKTNGVTFRRWLFDCNPGLTKILVDALGPKVLDDPDALRGLVPLAGDSGLHDRLAAARRANKVALERQIAEDLNVQVDPDAMFDAQIKRIHEYKRQLLNILETVARYNAIRAQPMKDFVPRVKIFAGKAAASYHMAKLVIKLAGDVARHVNDDPSVRGLLTVCFMPNYNVSLAEAIVPASDLSEQISTAGMEASGTGNMKFALNGALTIGTLDGANVEIGERVGDDNVFIFGLKSDEVAKRRSLGIDASETIAASHKLREVVEAIGSGVFSPEEPDRYRGLVDALTHHDYFMVCADFDAYCAAQDAVDERWRNKAQWWKSSALNTANMGFFSSDRAVREYASEIWGAKIGTGS
ncbi:MAG: glycogen/starch/alpha-glucan family phosphorylase, partial [Hyphomicrobiales bacterium]|nr:glycogen/starch/alpha-glucan family phosphorylase [Hyphomicrobiales bacterium]